MLAAGLLLEEVDELGVFEVPEIVDGISDETGTTGVSSISGPTESGGYPRGGGVSPGTGAAGMTMMPTLAPRNLMGRMVGSPPTRVDVTEFAVKCGIEVVFVLNTICVVGQLVGIRGIPGIAADDVGDDNVLINIRLLDDGGKDLKEVGAVKCDDGRSGGKDIEVVTISFVDDDDEVVEVFRNINLVENGDGEDIKVVNERFLDDVGYTKVLVAYSLVDDNSDDVKVAGDLKFENGHDDGKDIRCRAIYPSRTCAVLPK